jgi:uncharacterized protein YodC (DUF2158 family)
MESKNYNGNYISARELYVITPEEGIAMDVFKIGDLVHLKSGGPKMTVKSIDPENDEVYCQWFVGNNLHQKHFPSETLMRLPDTGYFVSPVGGFILDKDRRTLEYEGQRIILTPHETLIVDLFLSQPGVVFSHGEIVLLVANKQMTDKDAAEITRPLMWRLMTKLRSMPGAENWIQSVRGTGYIFTKEGR